MIVSRHLQNEPSSSPIVIFRPKHWSDVPPKRLVMPIKEGAAPIKNTASPHYSTGLYPAFSASGQDVWLPFASYGFPGLVLSAVGARCGKTFLANGEWSVVANTQVIRPKDISSQKYWWYVMNMPDWWETGGAAQPYVLVSKTLSRKWPTPPIDEQIKIARYLDYKNYQINKYIRIKKRQIDLLKELKQTIINDAVTGKIDVRTGKPYPKYKDSGIDWLGMIPEEWDVVKPTMYFTLMKGKKAALLTNTYIGDHPGQYPVFSGQTENDGILGYIDWAEFKFKDNVIFVTTVGARAMSTKVLSGEFSLSQNCALIIPKLRDMCTMYFNYAYTMLFINEKKQISLIMQPSLRFSDFRKFKIPYPSYNDQIDIEKHIENRITEIDGEIKRLTNTCELVKELQTRLISDVVTGKLDVRDVDVPDIPEDELEQENEAEEDPIEESENAD